jgi:hypothetical protein
LVAVNWAIGSENFPINRITEFTPNGFADTKIAENLAIDIHRLLKLDALSRLKAVGFPVRSL